MDKKIIDDIVWWIPFKKLRDNIRDYLKKLLDIEIHLNEIENKIKDITILGISDPSFLNKFRVDIAKTSQHEFWRQYLELIRNLDQNSIETVDKIIFDRVLEYKNINDLIYITGDEAKEIIYIKEYMKKRVKKIDDKYYIYQNYILPTDFFEPCIFYEKYRIDDLYTINAIQNKDIIDAGGYIGDSAIMLSDYTNKNVYCFEPLEINYNVILDTIKINKKNNIVPVKLALGNKNCTMDIFHDNKIVGTTALDSSKVQYNHKIEGNTKETIEITTLDSYVEKYQLNVGLIKTDLEGYEQNFILGAINTIKKQKPVLIISIYHNPDDFFKIKPLIEELNLGYEFKIIKPKEDYSIIGTILVAEVI